LSQTILIIDSRKGARCERVVRCAERLQCVVRCCRSAKEAIRHLVHPVSNNPIHVDIVVIDGASRAALAMAEKIYQGAPHAAFLFVAEERVHARFMAKITHKTTDAHALAGVRWELCPPLEDRLFASLAQVLGFKHSSCASTMPAHQFVEGDTPPDFTILDHLSHMIWSARADGVIDYYNPHWQLALGLAQEDLLRHGFDHFILPEDNGEWEREWQRSLSDGSDLNLEVRLCNARGEWHWYCVEGRLKKRSQLPERWYGSCVLLRESRDNEESGQFLNKVARRVTESLDYESTLTNLAQAVVPHFADWCAVDVLNDQGELERQSAAHRDPAMVGQLIARRPDIRASGLSAVDVIRTGKLQLITRIDQALIDVFVRDPEQRAFYTALQLRSLLRLPLRARDRTVGVVSFVLSGPGTRCYTQADIPLATEIARYGAIAVENARLYRKARAEIEERRRAEEALALSEARYRSLIEASAQIVWTLDSEGCARGDMQKWCAFTGQPIEAVLGYGWLDAFKPETHERLGRAFAKDCVYEPLTMEADILSRDGGYRCIALRILPLFDEVGRCHEWIGAGIDITREKTAAELLAQEKEQLAVTLNSLGEAVVTTGVDGRIVIFNKVAENLSGWPQTMALGRSLAEVFCVVDVRTRAPLEDPVSRMLKIGDFLGSDERAILRARDGVERVVAYTAAPIHDRGSRLSGAVIVFRDITSQQKLEEDFLKAQKLESVGVLAGGIAHDFNNILTAVIGNIALARMFAPSGDRVSHALAEAEKASWRARGLTQQLLTFAKGGAPIKQQGSLAHLLRETVPFALTGSNVKCVLSIADDLWPLAFDPGQLSQVINNLVLNASQAMPGGGIIRVEAGNYETLDGQGLATPPGRYVRLAVADEGVGIAPHHLDKIFDPYFTTKEGRTGLGLATTYSIIHRHEGVIKVQSEEGRGASFEIFLPVQGAHKQSLPMLTLEKKGQGRILVMDDEESLLELIRTLLCHLGYETEVTREGGEAFLRYQEALASGRPFAAVILDLTVPAGMGGAECLRRLQAIDPEVRAIVSSGYYNDPIVADCERFGFRAAVTKPYRLHDLDLAVRRALVENAGRLR